MHRFKKILVYLNLDHGRYDALERAAKLAGATGAVLKVIDVIEELPVYLRYPAYGYPSLTITLTKEKKEKLDRLILPVREQGIVVEADVLYGKCSVQLVREVLRNRHDLVMKTAEEGGMTPLFGTVARQLMRNCPCPVWLVKGGYPDAYNRVLAAVHLDGESDVHESLDCQVLDLARSLAELEHGELHVGHAWHVRHLLSLQHEDRDKLAKGRLAASERLRKLLAHAEVEVPPEWLHVVRGDAGDAVAHLVDAEKIDLIVMGTVARTGIAGVIIGNTAEQILGKVKCSILVLKPKGFLSPSSLDC